MLYTLLGAGILKSLKMKKLILLSLVVIALMSCTENQRARSWAELKQLN